MKRFVSVLSTLAACAILAPGCGSSDRASADSVGIANPNNSSNGTGESGGGGGGAGMDSALRFDAGGGTEGGQGSANPEGDDDCDETDLPTPDAHLRGTVYAPNLEIPISGALVYLTTGNPEPVPDEVYCAECVEIPCDSHSVLSEADGSFTLPAVAGPNQKLVVQKGQFLHITPIEVVLGNADVPADKSNLPGKWDAQNGEYIPRMAVVETTNDTIYNILAKIGLGVTDQQGEWDQQPAGFDLLSQADGSQLLDNLEAMRAYHIIFIPCMSQGGLGTVLSPQRIDNIRQWVEAGGKWYVTDWANEYLIEPFGDYQEFHMSGGDPDLGFYNTTGNVLDQGLLDWLEALPPGLKDIGAGSPNLNSLPAVELHDNWSGLDAIPEIIVQNDEGEDINVGHHPWVEGPCVACSPASVKPMTVSAGYGCGRMLFSTYHTNENAHLGLTPQELILLYIILEIGVCHGDPPPPIPPIG